MKKPVKIILSLVAVLVVAAVALPFLVPVDTYKAELVRRVKEATGRDLVIAGPMHATLLPTIGLSAAQVSLSNPKNYSTPNMLELEGLNVSVELMPLLSGRMQIKTLEMVKPVINLEVNAQGVPNWQFTPPSDSPPVQRGELPAPFALVSSAHAAEPVAAAGGALKELQAERIQVTNGTLRYHDARSKKKYTVEELNLNTAVQSFSSPLDLNLTGKLNGEALTLNLTLNSPDTLLAGKAADIALKLYGAPVRFEVAGKATTQSLEGDTVFAINSLPHLAKWTGAAFDWKGKTALGLSGKGKLACTQGSCSFRQGTLTLDETPVQSDISVNWASAVPSISANLKAARLDITPYVPVSDTPKQASFSLISNAQAAQAGWSTDPINANGLKAVNANITLVSDVLQYQNFILQNSTVKAVLNGGVLRASIPSADLYGGKGSGELTLQPQANGVALSHTLALSGVQAEPLLKDMNGFDRLSGSTQLNLSVSGQGANQQQIISSLAGNGRVMFTDGAVKGINLAQLVRDVKSAITLGQGGEAQKTDFAELSGSFSIAQGILHNNDLAMKAPLIRLSGEGDVDLPQQRLRYRLLPELVASLKGQGGKDKQGLEIPIIVEGPFDRLTFRPDLESGIRDALKDPEKVKETVKGLKEQIKENKGNIKDSLKDLKNNPDAVKDLLKGFGR